MSNLVPFASSRAPRRAFPRIAIAGFVAALAGATVAAAAEPRFDDYGTYRVYQGSRAIGTEVFSFEPHGDSILVFSRVLEALPRGGGRVDSLDKRVGMAFTTADFDLRGYESHQFLRGARLSRELRLSDTSFTSIREDDVGGNATVLVRPPGRAFVLDPQVFVLFDVIFRYMHGSSLDERPVPILFLGVRDTVFEVRVKRLGTEPIRWGTRTIQARKVSLSDAGSQYVAWMSPQGRMLRLTLDAVGLRVEREPEPTSGAKKPLPKKKPPG